MQSCGAAMKIACAALFLAVFAQPALADFNVLAGGREFSLTTFQGDKTATVYAGSDGMLTLFGEQNGNVVLAAINGSNIFELAASEKIEGSLDRKSVV